MPLPSPFFSTEFFFTVRFQSNGREVFFLLHPNNSFLPTSVPRPRAHLSLANAAAPALLQALRSPDPAPPPRRPLPHRFRAPPPLPRPTGLHRRGGARRRAAAGAHPPTPRRWRRRGRPPRRSRQWRSCGGDGESIGHAALEEGGVELHSSTAMEMAGTRGAASESLAAAWRRRRPRAARSRSRRPACSAPCGAGDEPADASA